MDKAKGLWRTEKEMSEQVRMAVMLLLVTVVAAAALAAVDIITKPRIEEQKRLALECALTIALPTADSSAIIPIMENDHVLYYKGYSSPDTSILVGYAFVAYGKGYSSTIETMVGVDTTGMVCGTKVLHQIETPGLGTKIEEIRYDEDKPWFQERLKNRRAEELVIDKDGGEINSITGATISSRAVTKSIAEGLVWLEEQLGGFAPPPVESN
jgi:electron transport complex protein RnfG